MATKTFTSSYIFPDTSSYKLVGIPTSIWQSDYSSEPLVVQSSIRLFKCDGEYYLAPYVNNSSIRYHNALNTRVSDTNSNLSTVNSLAYSKEHGLISDDVYFNPAWTSYYLAYKVDPISITSYGGSAYVDFYNPLISDSSQFSSCSSLSVETYNSSRPIYFYPKFEFSYTESTGGGESSGGSTDILPLIPAILMIPATIIVVCFFSVIYKMFMNRKVRG